MSTERPSEIVVRSPPRVAMEVASVNPQVQEFVQQVWKQYDTDNSGFLDKDKVWLLLVHYLIS